ncbi:ArsR family transcriptional regulator [Haloquadratum walsbyi]|jgi:transcriptional regulator, ArsR family|uniref:Putative transcriptional regulator n=1 Tax=Haloquadratum walsbyi J07HQW2 TaxID=1238425 RepID=U1MX16_9EURY|nr:ArsR family transcriptional regulator [Haloquadratum walsbyi]ERG94989.1 MAG: putative transcriptional regulator [Haloquadratum walsbyi J07HQW2]
MDSAVLLDLLGNENRRRILRLLSHKPCYVTEISEYLGVSPKAVIDHLQRLEDAGLVESRTDDRRRKYFHIARNLRLEVSVSPHGFGAKSAYPASRSLDMRGRCQYLTIDVSDEITNTGTEDTADSGSKSRRLPAQDHKRAQTPEENDPQTSESAEKTSSTSQSKDITRLAQQYRRLNDLESELSLAQRWVHGRLTDILDTFEEQLDAEADSRFYADVLAAITTESKSVSAIANRMSADPDRVETTLKHLAQHGFVTRGPDRQWRVSK